MWISAKDELPKAGSEVVFEIKKIRVRYLGRFSGERQKFIPYGEYAGFYDEEVLMWTYVPERPADILSEAK